MPCEHCRYERMLSCWRNDPDERPTFDHLAAAFEVIVSGCAVQHKTELPCDAYDDIRKESAGDTNQPQSLLLQRVPSVPNAYVEAPHSKEQGSKAHQYLQLIAPPIDEVVSDSEPATGREPNAPRTVGEPTQNDYINSPRTVGEPTQNVYVNTPTHVTELGSNDKTAVGSVQQEMTTVRTPNTNQETDDDGYLAPVSTQHSELTDG